jgi:hypothetical protein
VTQTASATAAENYTVVLGGAFTNALFPGSSVPIAASDTLSFTVSVQPALAVANHALVDEMFLSANTFYPPAETLKVSFSIRQSGRVNIAVYNVAGEKLRTLFDADASASANPNQAILYSGNTDPRLVWDGTADDGHPVASGTYLILIQAPGDYRAVKKVNLLR